MARRQRPGGNDQAAIWPGGNGQAAIWPRGLRGPRGPRGRVAGPVDRVGEPRSSQIRVYRLVRGALRHRAGPHPAATLDMRMESAEWGVPGRVPVAERGFGPREATDRGFGQVPAAYQSRDVVLDRARPRDPDRGPYEPWTARDLGAGVLPRHGPSSARGNRGRGAAGHRAISNPKAWFLGTHRGVGADQLPVYLDESCSAGTAAAPRWPACRRFSAWAPTAGRRPTRRSLGRPATSNGPRSRGRKTGLTRLAEA